MHAGVVQVGPAGAALREQVIFALVEHRPVDVAQKASLEREMKLRPVRFIVQRIGRCAEARYPGDPQAAAPQSRTCHGSRSLQVCLSRFTRPFDRTSGILHTPRRVHAAGEVPIGLVVANELLLLRVPAESPLQSRRHVAQLADDVGAMADFDGSDRILSAFHAVQEVPHMRGLASRKTSAW